ncbi:MAG UNVERIFIED_CONTAM: hypothetical protein LVR29_26685 [Microcystis novacekii LVE1205-3]
MNMPITENLPIKNIALVTRQERIPPREYHRILTVNIGFADVFVRLENSQETIIKLNIQKIEIQNVSDSQLQDLVSPPNC